MKNVCLKLRKENTKTVINVFVFMSGMILSASLLASALAVSNEWVAGITGDPTVVIMVTCNPHVALLTPGLPITVR